MTTMTYRAGTDDAVVDVPAPATQYHLNWTVVETHSCALTAAKLAEVLGITEDELAALPLHDIVDAGHGLADALATVEDEFDTFEYLNREDIDVEVCPDGCHTGLDS